jgi:hypothetical protein
MRRRSHTRRSRGSLLGILTALTFVISLVTSAGAAQAVVIDMSSVPNTSVAYNPFVQSGYVGVRLVPSPDQLATLKTFGIPVVNSSAPCLDPALTPDFSLSNAGLCWHGGPVISKNETFSFAWDPKPYDDSTAPYVEQFLQDVAASSHSTPLVSPFAVTSQYTGQGGGRALNSSLFGGGYDDQTGYPADGCKVSGPYFFANSGSSWATANNTKCLTDAQLQLELAALVTQNGVVGRTQPGYTPLLILQTPPGVEVCIDATAHLCSANAYSGSQNPPTVIPALFCSYHSQVMIGGRVFQYVVQPDTVLTTCDEPNAPPYPSPLTADAVTTDSGARLVSPLSQSMIAALVNPSFNGWFALGGSESNDNGCSMQGNQLDDVQLAGTSYYLQPEFNNGGALSFSPYSTPCAENVTLQPDFVLPSAVNQGDVVELDGSKAGSTLLVPSASYVWNFGDGTTAVGPAQAHSYARGGTYTVTLTVTDRGANTVSVSHTITVLGSNGLPVAPPPPPSPPGTPKPTLTARLQLIPRSFTTMLHSGIGLSVSSNMRADAIVTVSIPRGAAIKAHLKAGHGPAVTIGRGTISRITTSMRKLSLRLAPATVSELAHLKHLTVTVRLALVAADGERQAVVAAAGF